MFVEGTIQFTMLGKPLRPADLMGEREGIYKEWYKREVLNTSTCSKFTFGDRTEFVP